MQTLNKFISLKASISIVLLLAAVLVFLSAPSDAKILPSIKTMSFNLRADFNLGSASNEANSWVSTSGNHRRDLVIQVINDFEPDILGTQEAFNNQVHDLQNAMTSYEFSGVGRNNGLTAGEYSGIFYRSDRFTESDQGTFWLSFSPDRPSVYPGATFRIATWSILQDNQANNREYFVLNTHWAQGFSGTAAREYSAGLVRDQINSLARDRPLIVMGDLNAFDFQPAYLHLLGQDSPDEFQLVDSYRTINPNEGPNERTNHGYIGHIDGRRIDYILHSKGFKASSADIVHTSYDGAFPSDHYPITTTLTLLQAGDFDLDGTDFLKWQRNPRVETLADWKANYGNISLRSASPAAVPEPSSNILAALAFAVVLLREYRCDHSFC